MSLRSLFLLFFKLNPKKSFRLFGLCMRHPFFSMMTAYATLKTYRITEKKFPQCHHKNGKGNAYRHALWTALIMSYACKISSPEKSSVWTMKITNLHEELFVNNDLERNMDLHNNRFGIDFFLRLLPGIHRQFFESSFLSEPLYQASMNAKFIHSVSELDREFLVYIEEDAPSSGRELG